MTTLRYTLIFGGEVSTSKKRGSHGRTQPLFSEETFLYGKSVKSIYSFCK